MNQTTERREMQRTHRNWNVVDDNGDVVAQYQISRMGGWVSSIDGSASWYRPPVYRVFRFYGFMMALRATVTLREVWDEEEEEYKYAGGLVIEWTEGAGAARNQTLSFPLDDHGYAVYGLKGALNRARKQYEQVVAFLAHVVAYNNKLMGD